MNPTPALGIASRQPSFVEALMFDLLTKSLVLAVTEVFAKVFVPRTSVVCPILALAPDLMVMPFPAVPRLNPPLVITAFPDVSVRLPDVNVALPDVRTRLPEVIVKVPVVRVRPPAPFGVKVNPTAAFEPVPVKTLPPDKVIAVAAVVVANVPEDIVVNVLDIDPNVVQVATPAATAPKANTLPETLFTQS